MMQFNIRKIAENLLFYFNDILNFILDIIKKKVDGGGFVCASSAVVERKSKRKTRVKLWKNYN